MKKQERNEGHKEEQEWQNREIQMNEERQQETKKYERRTERKNNKRHIGHENKNRKT